MARISYDDQTAAAFRTVREVPLHGLGEWREAIRRHLRPARGMTLADIGAGTGAFAAAFSDWFSLSVLAIEPSAAMRARIPSRPGIEVLEGHAGALPLPADSADAAWLSTVIHHIPDLEAAAREIRRVLRPGGPVLIRQAFPGSAQTEPTSLAEFLTQADTFRHADTTMRNLTEQEFLRGKERLSHAVHDAGDKADREARTSWLDLLVLR